MEKEDNLLYRVVNRTLTILTSPEFLLGLVTGGAYIAMNSAKRREKERSAEWDEMENRTWELCGDDYITVMDRNRGFYSYHPSSNYKSEE